MLPFRTVRLLIPPGYEVEKSAVHLDGYAEEINLPGKIEHGLRPVAIGGRQPIPSALEEARAAFYKADEAFPSERAQLLGVQRWAGHRIAILRLFPVQYWAGQDQLLFCPQLQVEITLRKAEDGDDFYVAPPVATQAEAAGWIAGLVDNPELLSERAPLQKEASDPAGGASQVLAASEQFEYLLVSKAFLLPSFQPLVERKGLDGLAVKTESMEHISSNYAGADTAEKLRNYIRYAYTNWGIRYVLLGGDTAIVPCRYAYVYAGFPESGSLIPSDLYYGCLDGSWNRDGDGRWGEPSDGEGGGEVDLLAEVYVGRAPVETPAEAAIFVAKTIYYETNGAMNLSNALFMGTYLGYYAPGVHAQGGDMLDPLAAHFTQFTINWLDDRPYTSARWGASEALGWLNGSPQAAVYAGHGDIDAVMRLNVWDLDSLTNLNPFLAYSVSCNAGEYDNDPFSPDGIGEELLKRNSHGAFAAILNTRLGWFSATNEVQYSGEFQRAFFQELLERVNLGVANQFSKYALLGQVERTGVMPYRWCYYEITLLGDPHVWFWPAAPGNTLHGTPHWWLASYGWTNDFETADLADADADGMAAWKEFVAGTNPRQTTSALKINCQRAPGSNLELAWSSRYGRVYSLYKGAGVEAAAFALLTNLTATPSVNTYTTAPGNTNVNFFRVSVARIP